jgi:cell division protein FtsW
MKTAVTLLVFCVASLLALGMVMLYSAGMEKAGARYLMMQLVWCVMGVVICVTMVTVDYRLLRKFAWPIFIVAIVLLALVLIPHFGTKVKGARRWLAYGGFRFQASELGKLALIILLAWYGEHFQRQMHTWKKGIMIPGIFIAITLGLIFVEPDRGTTILMGAVSAAMLLFAGVRW